MQEMTGFWDAVALARPYAICTLVQTDNHTNTTSLDFYSLDTLPDAQPTVSKHARSNGSSMHRKNIFYNYASYLFAGTGLKDNCTNEMCYAAGINSSRRELYCRCNSLINTSSLQPHRQFH